MALSASTVWEVRATGSDSSGGGYVSGGTDYSQQNAAQGSGTNLTVDATTNTKVNPDGYTVAAADVGNLVQITTTGTGAAFTVGFYQITAATTGTSTTQRWTLDRSPAAINSAGATWAMGGALATIGKAASAVVASNTVYQKNATYSLSSGVTFSVAVTIVGYTTTRGDLVTKTVLQAAAASVTILTLSAGGTLINLDLDGNSQSSAVGLGMASQNVTIRDCEIRRNVTGIAAGSGATLNMFNVGVLNNTTAAISNVAVNCTMWFCEVSGNGIGWQLSSNSSGTGLSAHFCLFANNTGIGCSARNGSMFLNCTVAGNGGDGLQGGSGTFFNDIVNCAFYGNGGWGVNPSGGTMPATNRFVNCAFGANTSGNINSAGYSGVGQIALTVTPFTNSGAGDFSLNNTAGGGAACRAAGFPGAFPGGTTTGYADLGAAQHQGGGGGGLITQRGFTGGFAA